MRLMSAALQRGAGARLRPFLGRFVRGRLAGALGGAAATALVQSSSAVAAAVVSLVNSRALSLEQGCAVILGANVGTTVTAQLIAFDWGQLAPLVMALGLGCAYVWRRRAVGEVMFGFGALLFGLSLISASLAPWLGSGPVMYALTELAASPWKAVLVGFAVTAVVQSSSAVTSLTVGLAQAGGITLKTAVGICLGSNIGTVLTTLIASAGTSRESRATALADLFFNVLGALLALVFMDPFLALVVRTSSLLPRQVANAHTLFNLGTVLLALPFLPYLTGFAWWWAGITCRRKKY